MPTGQSSSKAKMIYLRPHKRPRGALSTIAIALGAIVVIACATVPIVFPHWFPSLFMSIAHPFWRAEFSIASGSLESREQLLAQNEDLRRQLETLRVVSEGTRAWIRENEELKMLLNRTDVSTTSSLSVGQIGTKGILAAVLVRPPVLPYDSYIIDIGSAQGMVVGDIAYAPGGIPIGSITETYADTSRVLLFSSPGEEIDGSLVESNTPLSVVGRGGGQYEASVSRDVSVAEGDVVMSQRFGGMLGIITAVIFDPALPYSTILIAPPINMYETRLITIVPSRI